MFRKALVDVFVVLAGLVVVSRPTAQTVCDLCADIPPQWAGYVVTSQESTGRCPERPEAQPAAPTTTNAGERSWDQDPRWFAAVASGQVPREMAGDRSVERVIDQLQVFHETDTEAIVMGRSGDYEYRVCMIRGTRDQRWFALRVDSVQPDRPSAGR